MTSSKQTIAENGSTHLSSTARARKGRWSARRIIFLVLGNALIFLLFIFLLEGGLWLLYQFPPRGTAIEHAAARYNLDYDRPVLQYLPECFEYSPELSYRIRPNSRCLFKTREYEVEIQSNSMGLRDDNDSLVAPEIILLGDSQAMGWGVNQDQTIEAILEKTTGRKVLNAAIPSYGTAREMRLLSMLDRSNLKTLIIAHNDNDYQENKLYRDRGNRLHIMRPQDYRVLQTRHRKDLNSAPIGKYLRHFWPLIAKEFSKKEVTLKPKAIRQAHKRQASVFLNALAHSGIDFSGINILVIEMNDHNQNDDLFLSTVENALQRNTPENLKSATIHTLDLTETLHGETYYRLGDHLNVSGSAKAAKDVSAFLDSLSQPLSTEAS
jgi:hypothetical protein